MLSSFHILYHVSFRLQFFPPVVMFSLRYRVSSGLKSFTRCNKFPSGYQVFLYIGLPSFFYQFIKVFFIGLPSFFLSCYAFFLSGYQVSIRLASFFYQVTKFFYQATKICIRLPICLSRHQVFGNKIFSLY